MPEVGTIFSKLSKPGQSISSEDMRVLEAFIIKWYSKQVEASTLDDARKAMVFERGIQPHQLPPTSAAVKFYTLRGHDFVATVRSMGTIFTTNADTSRSLQLRLETAWRRFLHPSLD